MTQNLTPEQKDRELIRELEEISADKLKLELWRYFSDRADKFAEQLWTTGTWLFGIITAVLTLPFIADFIEVNSEPELLIQFQSRPLTILTCLLGILLSIYSYSALRDIREHIERNWQRANLARTGEWKDAKWKGRKLHGWLVLMIFGTSSFIAFICLTLMAFLW